MTPPAVILAGCAAVEPTYVYDLAPLRARLRGLEALPWADKRIFFATMSNDHPALLKAVRQAGHGVFVNSPRHLSLALGLGFAADRVIYAASHMTGAEMDLCIDAGVHVVLDALDQLEAFCALIGAGGEAGLRVNVGSALGGGPLRLDPDYRFGVEPAELASAAAVAERHGVRLTGVHAYFGTDLMDPEVLLAGLERLCEAAAALPHLRYIDGGGGFGVPDELDDPAFDLDRYGAGAAAILARAEQRQGRPLTLFIEPGRYLSAGCGWFFAKVVGCKRRADRLLVGLDASVVQLPRMLLHPATARHPWRIVGRETAAPDALPVWLCGNSTYSRDFLAPASAAPAPAIGETVLFHNAGAYCRSMFSEFLGKARPPEIVLDSEVVTATPASPAHVSVLS